MTHTGLCPKSNSKKIKLVYEVIIYVPILRSHSLELKGETTRRELSSWKGNLPSQQKLQLQLLLLQVPAPGSIIRPF
jgi:hypothetical protein